MIKKALIFSKYKVYLPHGELPNIDSIGKSYLEGPTHFHVSEDFVALAADNFSDEDPHFVSLRTVLDDFPPQVSQALVTGMQLSQWDRVSQYCGACGESNEMQENELGKVCVRCGHRHYPFIQPVAIVLVKKGHELLLARGLPPRKHHSCLAGFIEVGESVEDCIHREIKEEVGVEVENIQYFGSQPWPFPSNLMLGFITDYKSGDIVLDKNEITDARWFTKENPPEVIPPKVSIARQMIDSVWG